MKDREFPAPPDSILPASEGPHLTFGNALAALAVLLSCWSLYLQFHHVERLTLGVSQFFAFTVNDLSTVSMRVSVANTGTEPAILTEVPDHHASV